MGAFDVNDLAESQLTSWIPARLGSDFGAVATHVPTGFERYARIFHPVDAGVGARMTWSDVALARGTTMHPTAQWSALNRNAASADDDGPGPPDTGNLAVRELRALCEVLRHHTSTPDDCYFGFWAGWNALSRPTRITTYQNGVPHAYVPPPIPTDAATPAPIARLTLAHRDYALFQGNLDLAERFGDWMDEHTLSVQSPNLFWPSNHAWLVATEVDFDSTLVAGNTALVDDIINSPALEALEVQPTDKLHSEADTINQQPQHDDEL